MAKDSSSSNEHQSAASHFMPSWFEAFRTRYVLTCLIIAQWITTTIMVVMVSVSNPGEPWTWTWLDVSNLIIAVLLGGAAAGVSLALSASMAEAFNSGHPFKGIFCFLGMSGLFAADVWAGMSERSVEAHPTNADTFLANVTNFDALKVIPPSVFFVSFLLAALVLYYGWTNRPPVVEPEEAAEARRRKELRDAQHKAEMRQYTSGGVGRFIGSNLRAAKVAATGSDTPALSSGEPITFADTNTPGIAIDDSDSGPLPANVSRLRPRSKGPWFKDDLMAYIPLAYPGVSINEAAALTGIKEAGNGRMKGTAYAASIPQAKAWVKRHYGEPKVGGNVTEVAG